MISYQFSTSLGKQPIFPNGSVKGTKQPVFLKHLKSLVHSWVSNCGLENGMLQLANMNHMLIYRGLVGIGISPPAITWQRRWESEQLLKDPATHLGG